jgi:hypothetical protein
MLGISDRSVLIARRISKFEYPYRNGIKEERSANLRMFRIDHMKTSALDNLLSASLHLKGDCSRSAEKRTPCRFIDAVILEWR